MWTSKIHKTSLTNNILRYISSKSDCAVSYSTDKTSSEFEKHRLVKDMTENKGNTHPEENPIKGIVNQDNTLRERTLHVGYSKVTEVGLGIEHTCSTERDSASACRVASDASHSLEKHKPSFILARKLRRRRKTQAMKKEKQARKAKDRAIQQRDASKG